MATASILQLAQAVSLTGSEQLEAVQAGSSVRLSIAQILAILPYIITPIGPTAVIDGVPASGANNNYTVNGQMGPTVGFVDLTPAAACNITGLEAGFDGQMVTITNLSAYAMTLNALNSGSLSANQFRMAADFILTQNNSKSFKYSETLALWITV